MLTKGLTALNPSFKLSEARKFWSAEKIVYWMSQDVEVCRNELKLFRALWTKTFARHCFRANIKRKGCKNNLAPFFWWVIQLQCYWLWKTTNPRLSKNYFGSRINGPDHTRLCSVWVHSTWLPSARSSHFQYCYLFKKKSHQRSNSSSSHSTSNCNRVSRTNLR